jgi:hypothetical protein
MLCIMAPREVIELIDSDGEAEHAPAGTIEIFEQR